MRLVVGLLLPLFIASCMCQDVFNMHCRHNGHDENSCLARGCSCVWCHGMLCTGRIASVDKLRNQEKCTWNTTACEAVEKRERNMGVFLLSVVGGAVVVLLAYEIKKKKTDNASPNIILSFDTEVAGTAPGLSSMINIGFVALTVEKKPSIVYQYEANLQELPDARDRLANHEWWNKSEQATALAYVTSNPRDPKQVMEELALQLTELQKKYGDRMKVVAWPAAFDWQWLNYYMWRFTKCNPLGYMCLDLSSYHWGAVGTLSYPDMDLGKLKAKTVLPAGFVGLPEHSGRLDAYYQGIAFIEELLKNSK